MKLRYLLLIFFVAIGLFFVSLQLVKNHTPPHALRQGSCCQGKGQSMAVFSLSSSQKTQSRPSAPLDHLSPEEERKFPGAIIVESSKIAGLQSGEKTRLPLLKTHFKYPMIRTEEVINSKTQ